MFLGNLSAANEHEARKKSKSKKKKSKSTASGVDSVGNEEGGEDDAVALSKANTPQDLRRLAKGTKPILYSVQSVRDGKIPNDVILQFLTKGTEMLLDEGNINEVIDFSVKEKLGLHDAAIHFQRDILEYNYQIEREYGCRYLAMIPQKHDKDIDIVDAAKLFMFTALRSFLTGLRQRSARYKSGDLTPPDKTKPMSRTTIMEFFEGCNALNAMPETKAELAAIYEETKEAPNARVVELQKSIIELLGYDPEFGIACLSKISTDFAGDREIRGKFQGYAACAEFTVNEATWTEAYKKEFYRSVPIMMTNFPHLYMMQQQAAQQQRMMQAQQQERAQAGGAAGKAGDATTGGGAGDNKKIMMDGETLRASGMLAFLTAPDGRIKLANLAAKVQSSKSRLEPMIADWDLEKKKVYFESFKDHPLLNTLAMADDPADKMRALMDMSEGDIDEMMTLLLVIAQSDDGSLLASLREEAAKESADGDNTRGRSTMMNHVVTTMSSLASFSRPAGGAQGQCNDPSHGHNHSHSHAHGHHHGHGHSHGHGGHHDQQPSVSQHTPSIITGNKGEAMDR